MNLHDLHELQEIHTYPCLTITLPTHRTWPDNKQDPIRVKNLVTEATNRLLGEFPKREVGPLLERLDAVVAGIDYKYTLDGLVLAVTKDLAREYVLPFGLAERVVVDDTFFTRDLVRALNRTRRYWVLSLSEQPTRLYSATREHLEEVTTGGFPMLHVLPGGEAPLPGGPGINRSRHRDDRHRQFFRAVDKALSTFMAEDPLPLALAGVARYQAFFREVTSRQGEIIGTLSGSYDHMTAHDLGRHIWPPVSEGFAARRREVLQQLDAAAGQDRLASTLGEVWRQATMGRADLLVVEDGFHQPARPDDMGLLDLQVDDPGAPGVMDDAVDEVITTVLAKGGRVVFVEDGELAQYGRIAVMLRY
jgi:Bacterial archaeo-eukaryotic release factor family 3